MNKQISPIFNCVTPESVSLAMLARQGVVIVRPVTLSTTCVTLGHFILHILVSPVAKFINQNTITVGLSNFQSLLSNICSYDSVYLISS